MTNIPIPVSSTAEGVASWCDVPALTDKGLICGEWREGIHGSDYASFRNIPYAKPPLGELRFQELQEAEPWGILNTTQEGPICPQYNISSGSLQPYTESSEACIHANVHVPKEALLSASAPEATGGAPILVMVHGGAFVVGSGDASLYGPERLVSEGIIVITFNYRLNVFGFLSLNSTSIPGNQGLRDVVTLLRWVRRNARAFGGNPDDVTLAGHSAGSVIAHLLSLTKPAQGLFKRVILMSGTATSNFYTPSPAYAQNISTMFLDALGVNTTDPEEAHRQLVQMPLEKLMAVNNALLEQTGLVLFVPAVESKHEGVMQILDEDPAVLIAKGRGKDVPLLVSVTDVETESFRTLFEMSDILAKIKANPVLLLPPGLPFVLPPEVALEKAQLISKAYFSDSLNMESYIQFSTDEFFHYPAFKLAQQRQETGGAPMYMYEFAYNADYSVLKDALKLNYTGAAHTEDLTYVFQVNAKPNQKYSSRDQDMKRVMTAIVSNFVQYGQPSITDSWRPANLKTICYQLIEKPEVITSAQLSEEQINMMRFFDSLQKTSRQVGRSKEHTRL